MKRPSLILAVVLCNCLALNAFADDRPAGHFDFGKLPTSSAGGEQVEIAVGGAILGIAAKLIDKKEPEAAALFRSVKSVRVHVLELKDDNRKEMLDRVKQIRADLDAKGWDRVVSVQQKKDDVAVFLKTRGEEAIEGLVVTVLDGDKEAVLVNIVGDIKPEQVALLGEKLKLDPLKKFAAKGKK
jgi:hypothetical protein